VRAAPLRSVGCRVVAPPLCPSIGCLLHPSLADLATTAGTAPARAAGEGSAKYQKLLDAKRSEQKVEPPLQQRVGTAFAELRALEGKFSKAVSYYERPQMDLDAQRQ
ncbi:unnamed protein product, partial [Prorocentrum cordatum]